MMKKKIISLLAVASICSAALLGACTDSGNSGTTNEGTNGEQEKVETWSDAKSVSTQNCGNPGVMRSTSNLGGVKDTRTAATGNHTDADNDHVCDVCGYVDMSESTKDAALEEYGYYVEDVDKSGTYTSGDYIYFGSYPQGMLDAETDADLISSLNSLTGEKPTAQAKGAWTGYGYYDNGNKSDYMWYQDVTENGAKYRAVYMTAYRPYYSQLGATGANSNVGSEGGHGGNGFATETVYWFRYEPIKWFILDYLNGEALLSSTRALDSQPYQETYTLGQTVTIPDTSYTLSDWEHCSLRSFLNGSFSGSAFTDDEKAMIKDTQLDNRYTSASPDNQYAVSQKDTTDKVFLLSYQDMVNTNYGYTEKANYGKETQGNKINDTSDPAVVEAMLRRRSNSDYSEINGVRTSSQALTKDGEAALAWMLRSPGRTSSSMCYVDKYGSITVPTVNANSAGTSMIDGLAINSTNAVVPALWLKLGK